ncbi:GGDEF domain-containing protein [Leeia oryzae]|uniref:GGDEF domain-containing protein n=1 Tax=Leeia oryzae TaxID=356662 RepID=UPI0003794849|nr:GGDEF domain-containing protein [Leeia oryzae]
MPASPADIARIALIRLAEQALPPTPENYARFYYEVTGEKSDAPDAASPMDEALIAKVHEAVDAATSTTVGLVQYLGGSNKVIKDSIEDLTSVEEKHEILKLLNSLLFTAKSMHETVESSRVELNETRQTLQTLQHEVESTNHGLHHDHVTGAQNRLGLDKTLPREVAKAQQNKSRLTVCLISVDSFDEYKGRFGIDLSHKILQHMVTIGRSVMRDSDSMVRYGDEEFLLILPETDLKGAKFVMDRLQLILQRSPLFLSNDKLMVSISAGIAQMGGNEKSHSLVMRADRALFAAKSLGTAHIEFSKESA